MKSIRKLLALLFFICFTFLATAQSGEVIYIKAGKLFDSKNEQFIQNQIIKVDGNRISEVGNNINIPKNATVIDLSEYTILPGLIDAHTHLLYLESPKSNLALEGVRTVVMEGDALRALRGAARAKTFLEAGFTTIKDLGNSGQFLDVALKTAINEGSIIGPRMYVSGPIISSEGGQMSGINFRHRHLAEEEYRVVRSVDDAIAAVRENITYGADLIKICAENTPNNTNLTLDEMKAIVKMAHRYNRKVTAHATGDRAAREAVIAGVDGIEHGYQLEDSTLMLMAEKGVPLIPTDASKSMLSAYLKESGFEGDLEATLANFQDDSKDRLQRAIAHGITIVAGSDMYIDINRPQGEAAKEVLVSYFEEGMQPKAILKAATYNSALFLGRERLLGSIQSNALADIIAVRGDIEKDFPKAIFDVVFVMKNGKVYVEKFKD